MANRGIAVESVAAFNAEKLQNNRSSVRDDSSLSGAPIRIDSPNLDVLRSLAVLFVVASHLPIVGTAADSRFHLQALGILGVDIFFVHTCLVLMLSLQRQSDNQRGLGLFRSFYVRRAFRIYPLSMIVVLTVAAAAHTFSSVGPSLRQTIANVLLVQNVTRDASLPAALWSLPFEVQMYLFLPLIFLIVSRNAATRCRIVGAMWIASVLVTLVLWRAGLRYDLVKYVPCFLPGVFAYCLTTRRRSLRACTLFMYVGIVAIFAPIAVARGAPENVIAWPICLGLGVLIPQCRELTSRRLSSIGHAIARYSYGIYLLHGSVAYLAFVWLSTNSLVLRWLSFLIGTGMLSFLAFHSIEKPGIAYGVRLARIKAGVTGKNVVLPAP